MNNHPTRYIIPFVLSGMILSALATEVTFDNRLSTCMSIELKTLSQQKNVLLADTTIVLHQSIGECGCFSAQANYVSSIDIDGFEYAIQEGQIELMSGGDKILVLTSDSDLLEHKKVQVRLNCTPPL